MSKRFVVARENLRQTRWGDEPSAELQDGQVRTRINAFALTANNITHATFGNAMNYWGFYPTGDPTTGCIPVRGSLPPLNLVATARKWANCPESPWLQVVHSRGTRPSRPATVQKPCCVLA